MPIDLVEIALLGLIPLTLVVVLIMLVKSKKRMRIGMVGGSFLGLVVLLYVYLYYATVIIHSSSAETGNLTSMYKLGASYMHNYRGSRYDPPRGLDWLRRAAEKDYIQAQMKLGSHHLAGISARVDEEKALFWFKKAVSGGNAEAKELVEEVEEHGFNPMSPAGPAWVIVQRWVYLE